jgi:hypothetical protein
MIAFNDLWPLPYPEIVVVTGPYGCGKSTFTLGTGASPERTLVLDFEKSQSAFAKQLPLTYVDMQAEITKANPLGARPLDIFNLTSTQIEKIPADRYDVLVLDNASLLEDGILAYVEKFPTEFGHSAQQYQSMSALKWGDVKAKYSQLLNAAASKVRMIFIIVHLRDKWAGNTIVKDALGKPVQEPKGKETLEQLSSLFVWLEHGPGGVPSAKVLKCRVDRKVWVPDPTQPPADVPAEALAVLQGEPGVVNIPVLPLRLPRCTWPAIRTYMRQPADLVNPKPGEKPTDQQLTEDDRLRMRSIIAQADAEKAAVDKMNIEAGENNNHATLIAFAKSLKVDITPADVAAALKRAGIGRFNPDQWDQMKEAIRTAVEGNRETPESKALNEALREPRADEGSPTNNGAGGGSSESTHQPAAAVSGPLPPVQPQAVGAVDLAGTHPAGPATAPAEQSPLFLTEADIETAGKVMTLSGENMIDLSVDALTVLREEIAKVPERQRTASQSTRYWACGILINYKVNQAMTLPKDTGRERDPAVEAGIPEMFR